jgi:hypothetical protein
MLAIYFFVGTGTIYILCCKQLECLLFFKQASPGGEQHVFVLQDPRSGERFKMACYKRGKHRKLIDVLLALQRGQKHNEIGIIEKSGHVCLADS